MVGLQSMIYIIFGFLQSCLQRASIILIIVNNSVKQPKYGIFHAL
jgi:hypothetical protein